MNNPALTNWATLIGRVLLALIFVLSGVGKIFDPAGTIGYISSVGLPLPQVGLVVAIVVEVIGGIALIVGFKTKIAALALAAFTLVAAFAFHFNFADQIQMIMFLKNIAITGGLLYVVAFGAGRYSLDRA
jgi:putative oxidoreductase